MKFVFPQNYNSKNKVAGFLDYTALIFALFFGITTFLITSLFTNRIFTKLCFAISGAIPFIIFSFANFNNESFIEILIYTLKFAFKPKIYLFDKIRD